MADVTTIVATANGNRRTERRALPLEFDASNASIMLYIDHRTHRYVKTVQPLIRDFAKASELGDREDRSIAEARRLWVEKYGEAMPAHVEGDFAQGVAANTIPYDGATTLTSEELARVDAIVQRGDDLTLDLLWLVVEQLGWRPGKPVADNDPGWRRVQALDDGSEYIVRDLLGMPAEN